MFCNLGYTQKKDSVSYKTADTSRCKLEEGYVPYIVGSSKIPGYKVQVLSCKNDASVTLSNGSRIAGLSCIISESEDYVGGQLIFKGDTTRIRKIFVSTHGKHGAKFTVKGEKFDMSLTLQNGAILALDETQTTFNTENVGIWIIRKRL